MAVSPLGFSLPDLSIAGSAATGPPGAGRSASPRRSSTRGPARSPIRWRRHPERDHGRCPPRDHLRGHHPASALRPRHHHRHVRGPRRVPEQPGADRPDVHAAGPAQRVPRRRAASSSSTWWSTPTARSSSPTSQRLRPADPVMIASQALPELRATDLDVAGVPAAGRHDPADITIVNYGTAYSGEPVQVALVASTTPSFTVGSSIIALYSSRTTSLRLRGVRQRHDRRVQPDAQPAEQRLHLHGPRGHPAHQPQQILHRSRGRPVRPDQPAQPAQEPAGRDPHGGPEHQRAAAGRGRVDGQLRTPFPLPASGVFIGITPTTTTNDNSII